MALNKDAQTGLSVAGGATQAAGSFFGPYGALIGGVLGGGMSALSGILGEAPEVQGPTGGQRASASLALMNASEIASRKGMSSDQMSRMRQLSSVDETAQLQLLNTLEQTERLSPLAKEAVSIGVIKEAMNRQVDIGKQLANLDIAAEREREQSLIAAADSASRTATVVQQAKQRQQTIEDMWEQTRWQNFNKGMTGIGDFAGGIMELVTENPDLPMWSWKSPTKAEKQAKVDPKVAETAGIAGALKGIDIGRDPYLDVNMPDTSAQYEGVEDYMGLYTNTMPDKVAVDRMTEIFGVFEAVDAGRTINGR